MASQSQNPKIKLKLIADMKAEKVLFAEAGKDFIDFLIYLLNLPLGTVARNFKGKNMMGCLENLHGSIEKLDDVYFQPNQSKNSLLNPTINLSSTEIPLLLSDLQLRQYSYQCPSHFDYVSDVPNLLCPACKKPMSYTRYFVAPSRANTSGNATGGFVERSATFMVMDTFEILPMVADNFISALKNGRVKGVGVLDTIDLELGVDEGLKLLKLSLECKTVLTSFYFQKKEQDDDKLHI